MKKTIAILLLTALCMTVLSSCDLGNGLVAELFGEMNEDVLVDPDEEYWGDYAEIEIDPVLTDMDDVWTPTETTPPYEIDTAYDTTADFSVDDVPVDPEPDVLLPLNLQLDGDLSDWTDDMCVPLSFDKSNLDPFVGEVGDDAGFTMRMTADETYVYFAFEAQDGTVAPGNREGYHTGDFFQIAMDLNGAIAESESFERAIYYSFNLQEDGTIDVTVQCIYGDAGSTMDYRMASDDDPGQREGEIIGTTCAKADGSGWVAEFAISWETLYRDLTMKLKNEDLPIPDINVGIDHACLKMLVCYMDCEQPDATLTGAWGTPNQMDTLMNGHGWYPENAGLIAHLYPDQGRGEIEHLWS